MRLDALMIDRYKVARMKAWFDQQLVSPPTAAQGVFFVAFACLAAGILTRCVPA